MREMEMEDRYNHNFLEEELHKPTVFINENLLSIDYVPEHLPHRENELREISRHFKIQIEKPGEVSRRLIISGPVGSGKTSITKKFGQMLFRSALKRNIDLHYIHINCRTQKSNYMVLLAIAQELNKDIPNRGYSAEEVLKAIISFIEKNDKILFIVLDELDYFVKRNGADLLYDLTRAFDSQLNPTQRISLVGVARSANFMQRLDESTKSALSASIMKLDSYTSNQLNEILQSRINQSFIEGAVSHEAVELVADIASENGDARHALELIWYAGKYADDEMSSMVFPDHVRRAKATISPSLRYENLKSLSSHESITLLAIVRSLKYSRNAYVETGSVESNYQLICEELGERARGHTSLWTFIKELERHGIIITKLSGKGIKGNTTLINLPDLPVTVLEKELLKRWFGGK